MKVKCKCCGKVIDTNDAIRVPIKLEYDDEMQVYVHYCSKDCLVKDDGKLTIAYKNK